MNFEEVMDELKVLSCPNQKDLEGMARFGINTENAWCISMPKLRKLGKGIINFYSSREQSDLRSFNSSRPRSNNNEEIHKLALLLWDSEIHEARILAGLIDDPKLVTEEQMEKWVSEFDSWDVCDQICSNLFDKTKYAYKKAKEWAGREEVFAKRAGFVLMAALAVHDKKAPDKPFTEFLEIIEREATDERNFVRKAVNWALRSIGKSRSKNLYNLSLKKAKEILETYPPFRHPESTKDPGLDSSVRPQNDNGNIASSSFTEKTPLNNVGAKTARWIANDAIRELEKEYIKKRFN